jgi:hypothetical protein
MVRALLLIVFCAGSAFGAAAPVREVTSQAQVGANQPMPGFYKGYVYFLHDGRQSQFRLYAPDGHLMMATDIQGPRDSPPDITGIAIDTDGTIAVSYIDRANRNRGGIDFLDATGRRIGNIDTGRYSAGNLCYGEDHTLWSFGMQHRDSDNRMEEQQQDHMTVRKYAAGREVGAYLPRSSFSGGGAPGEDSWQEMRIAVTHDRVGVLAWAQRREQEWVELDLNGNVLGRWKFSGRENRSFAFTSDDHLYALRWTKLPYQLVLFDRASSAWKEVETPQSGNLYGADGDELVFASWNHGPMQFRWYKQPAPPTNQISEAKRDSQ